MSRSGRGWSRDEEGWGPVQKGGVSDGSRRSVTTVSLRSVVGASFSRMAGDGMGRPTCPEDGSRPTTGWGRTSSERLGVLRLRGWAPVSSSGPGPPLLPTSHRRPHQHPSLTKRSRWSVPSCLDGSRTVPVPSSLGQVLRPPVRGERKRRVLTRSRRYVGVPDHPWGYSEGRYRSNRPRHCG